MTKKNLFKTISKTFALSIALFGLCLASFAQNGPSYWAKQKAGGMQVGISFSPDLAYRILSNKNETELSETMVNFRNKSEQVKFGMTGDLSFSYWFQSRLGIQTGLSYSNRGYQSAKTELRFPSGIDPYYGFVYEPDSSGPSEVRFLDDFHYLGLPILLNFRTGPSKWQFFSSAGIIPEFLLKSSSRAIFYYNDGSKEKESNPSTQWYERINIVGSVSVGLEYHLSKDASLRIAPMLRFGLLPLSKTPIRAYLYNAGLQFGYYHNL